MALLPIADKSSQADITTSNGLGNRSLGLYDRGGPVKAFRFSYTNDTGGTLAAGSNIQLATVGPCLILPTSTISVSALGASRTLDLGFQEHEDNEDNTVAADIDALIDGADVSAAIDTTLLAVGVDAVKEGGLELKAQTDILAQINGGTIPNGATIEGFLFVIAN